MIRRPPRSTRTDTLFPYTTLFRSEADLVVAHVVGIARLAADALEPERARVRIQVRDPGDVPVARGDLALALAGGEVVQVQAAPVGLLAEPDELVALRQVTPVARIQRRPPTLWGAHGFGVHDPASTPRPQ